MRRSLRNLIVAVAFAAGSPVRADDAPRRVRSTATVEVIDDARNVDDIISRMKSQPAPGSAKPGEAVRRDLPQGPRGESPRDDAPRKPVAPRLERPALPSALPDDAHGARPGERGEHAAQQQHHKDDRHADRDPHRGDRVQHGRRR